MTQPLTALSTTDLNALAGKFSGVRHALQVSRDGLLMASTDDLPSHIADPLSAAVTGMSHLAAGVARVLNESPTQHIAVGYGDAQLLIIVAGDESVFAVLASGEADLGVIGEELAMLAARLTPAAGVPA